MSFAARGGLFSTLLVVSASALAGELRIPLTVAEPNGLDRTWENVSTGVPLRPGRVSAVRQLRLLDEQGAPVAAQFRPLARWWRPAVRAGSDAYPDAKGDNSLRWVLVDFMVRLSPSQTKQFVLSDAGGAKPAASPLTVSQDDEHIVVTTGAAQFTINRKRFNVFDRVRLDLNGDGKYEPDEQCVSPDADAGSVVEDTYGLKYFSGEGTSDVTVEESGPVRVCVLARGTHRARGGKGCSRGMYGFEVRMHFFAGKSTVRIDPLITNTGPEPNGSPTFEDYSLITRLNLEPEVSSNPDYQPAGAKRICFRMYGSGYLDEELAGGQSAVLYQDSNGAESWRVNCGLSAADGDRLARFRGYRILRRGKDGEQVLASGDRARGLTLVGGKRWGVVIVPRYFWQLFPKAIEVGYDGRVRIGILPREYSAVHWIEDASAAGQELFLHFYGRDLKSPAAPQYPRDTSTRSRWWQILRDRPWPDQLADSLIPRLVALAPRQHYADCGALVDLGPYALVESRARFPIESFEQQYIGTAPLKGNAFGWQVFGCRWEEYAGHSPWNYEPIYSSDFLHRFLVTGDRTWLEFGLRRLKHFRDVRAYKIDETRVFGYATYTDFRTSNVCEEWASRKGKWPQDEEAAKYSQGRYGRKGWYLPNPAHNNLDELNDLYCLFGDSRALAGMRNVAAVGGWYIGLRATANIHRADGWCFRSLLRYRDLTGSDECLPYLTRALENCWAVAGRNRHTRVVPDKQFPNNWFYTVFGRAVVLSHVVTGDERMRDLVIGLARGRTKGGQGTLNSYAWDQTHRREFFSINARNHVRLGGYFPACNAHLWMKDRADEVPPDAVADLAGEPAGGGAVKLTWTTPGDDDRKGVAAVYQLKWADLPLVEAADDEGHVNFWAAENVSGEPPPLPAGSKQQMVVKGLRPGTYYFALKTRDELNNESEISNFAKATVP